jgi:hypothetical protein
MGRPVAQNQEKRRLDEPLDPGMNSPLARTDTSSAPGPVPSVMWMGHGLSVCVFHIYVNNIVTHIFRPLGLGVFHEEPARFGRPTVRVLTHGQRDRTQVPHHI